MTRDELVHKTSLLAKAFPMSVAFYQWICRRVVVDNIDLYSKNSRDTRWNWRWDYEVSFLMNNLLLNGRQVLLVTSDKDMTKMLQCYGYGARVMTLDHYLRFLSDRVDPVERDRASVMPK